MEVLRSCAFVAAICSAYSRRRKYIRLISSANMSIGIVFANSSTASSDTVLKSLICLIELKRCTEDSFLFVIPTESASYHIGQEYNIIDVTTLDIILLLNGYGPPIFSIIVVSAPCLFATEFYVLLKVQSVIL